MSAIRYSLNRTCSPNMTLAQFVELARAVGVDAVEMRNDIAGGEFVDGTEAAVISVALSEAGLGLAKSPCTPRPTSRFR
jgi:2-keto-myo-inositol isomerase